MPASPTAYNPKQIQRSPADLWLNLAEPAAGTHIIALDTGGSGTPDATANPNAVHFGLLEVPSILNYTPKPDFEGADQDTGAVAAFANTEELTIEATMSQVAFNAIMQHCLPAGVFSDGTKEGLTFGAGANILIPSTCLAVIAPSSDTTYKWLVAVLYKAVPMSAIKLSLGRSKTATYQVQFRGLSDVGRVSGDRIGSIYKTN